MEGRLIVDTPPSPSAWNNCSNTGGRWCRQDGVETVSSAVKTVGLCNHPHLVRTRRAETCDSGSLCLHAASVKWGQEQCPPTQRAAVCSGSQQTPTAQPQPLGSAITYYHPGPASPFRVPSFPATGSHLSCSHIILSPGSLPRDLAERENQVLLAGGSPRVP